MTLRTCSLVILLIAIPGGVGAAEGEDVVTLPPTTVEAERPTPTPEPGGGPSEPVVTPTLTQTRLDETGTSTTVITSEDIARTQYPVLSDLLRFVPGADVVQSGPHGGLTSVFLRGESSAHTKVLLDGIPLNDPSSASRGFDFSSLSVDNIERIEIVRGPQSTLYGSDAMGGVINIITKRGDGPAQVHASAMGGSYGTTFEQARISGGTDRYHYSLGGSFYYADGFSAASERLGATEDDAYRLGTLSGRCGWTPTDTFDVDYVFRYVDSRAEIDDASFALGLPPTDDLYRLYVTDEFFSRIQLRWDMLDGGLEQKVAWNFADYNRRDTDDLFPSTYQGQTSQVDYQANLLLLPGNTLTVGVDYWTESATSIAPTGFPAYAEAWQDKIGLYLQDQVKLAERWFTTVGFRWDDYNVAGPAQTYRLTSVYHFRAVGTALHGSLGTGFRAPSLAESLFPFGNANLRPETNKGWECGLTQRFAEGQASVDVTYFRKDDQNLILFDLSTFTLQNIGQARSHGVEVTAAWNIGPCTVLNGSYTRTDTLNLDTDQPLVRRPRDKGTVGIGQRFLCDRAYANLYALIVGPRTDSNDGTVVLPAYSVVNLAGSYQVTDAVRGFARLENLFNQQYELITGYATPGFSVFGGLEGTW